MAATPTKFFYNKIVKMLEETPDDSIFVKNKRLYAKYDTINLDFRSDETFVRFMYKGDVLLTESLHKVEENQSIELRGLEGVMDLIIT